MVIPLIIGAGGLAVSGAANVYRAYRQKQLYDTLGRSYKALDAGYSRHLARHGRSINPNRAVASYYGQYLRSQTNSDNAIATGIGATAGTLGAGSMIASKTWRMMK